MAVRVALAVAVAIACVAMAAASGLRASSTDIMAIHQSVNNDPTRHPAPNVCVEITIPGGGSSLFWKSLGWKYQDWSLGACGAQFTDVEETMKDFGGFSGVTMTKRGLPGPTPPMAAVNKDGRALVIHSVSNNDPTRHTGANLCTTLTIAGGDASPFWKALGWKFVDWKAGNCPSKFNVVEQTERNYGGYNGVDLVKHGIGAPHPPIDDIARELVLHSLVNTDPGHHKGDNQCFEIAIADGVDSTFWKLHGYEFKSFLPGRCPREFRVVEKEERDYSGFRGVVWQKRGLSAPPPPASQADPTITIHMLMNDNPGHHQGANQCDTLTIVDGHDNIFWKKFWHNYHSYAAGPCPTQQFTLVEEEERHYYGYPGVTFQKRGIAPADDDSADATVVWGHIHTLAVDVDTTTGHPKNQCNMISFKHGEQSAFWQTLGWEYAAWQKGSCPPQFTYIEKVVADFAGYVDVTYVHAGVPPPPPPPGAM